jgi:hypothetical protein
MKPKSEYAKFDEAMERILSVSHDELRRREAEWKKRRKRKKRAGSAPASRAPDA